MSVATEFPPDVCIPAAARPRSLHAVPRPGAAPMFGDDASRVAHAARPAAPAAAALGAGVIDLDRWRHQSVGAQAEGRRRIASGLRTRPDAAAAPVRLTRRGRAALAIASGAVALAVVAVAWLSAPVSAGAGGAGSPALGSAAVVTVHSGDSLWSIAAAVAPDRDPRLEVARLQDLNHLSGDTVSPGQLLRLR